MQHLTAQLPAYVTPIFGLTTLLTLILFIRTIRISTLQQTQKKAPYLFIGSVIWLSVQASLSYFNVYNSDTFPPKILLLGILPMILLIILTFISSKGRQFADSLPIQSLTLIHIVRIPVEIVLWWLYLYDTIPLLMTFEGRNFDILAGVTTPVILYFGFTKQKLSPFIILLWNFGSLGLLINIVVNALLSTPSPIQQFAFEQPNIAILNFPLSWLPTFIVPIVFFSHLTSIRILLRRIAYDKNKL